MVPLSRQEVLESLAISAVSPCSPPAAELAAPKTTLSSLPVQALVVGVGAGVAVAVADGRRWGRELPCRWGCRARPSSHRRR